MTESDRDRDRDEPVTVTDKRRIDPQTGAVRDAGGPAPRAFAGESPEEADKAAELLADLQRVQADFANYRKRALRDHEVAAERAKAVVLSQLLGVLDDLERARSHGDLDTGPLKAVADKLTGVLTGLGLAEFGTEGEAFDPVLHEAVQHEGDAGSDQLVIGRVMRKGYRLGEQVLRHALVGVVETVEASETAESDQ
ncbi:MAG: nucleotide exchange factor GrpE [Mycobacterium sp.]